MKMKSDNDNYWDSIITSNHRAFDFQLTLCWEYRDLLFLLVKRDITTFYKQTILGPLWFFIQPLISTIVFTVIFNRLANVPTDEVPPFLFYMSGIVAWNYFSSCLNATSDTFKVNANIFGKVYFPRILMPLSKVISLLLRFIIQLIMFFGFYVYYLFYGNNEIEISIQLLFLFPIIVFHLGMLGLGMGMLVSSFTTKYRDLNHLISFGTQLLMYASPIVYPLSIVSEKHKLFLNLNPMTSIIEGTRLILIGKGTFEINMYMISLIITIITFIIGLISFNKIEKSFIDTI